MRREGFLLKGVGMLSQGVIFEKIRDQESRFERTGFYY